MHYASWALRGQAWSDAGQSDTATMDLAQARQQLEAAAAVVLAGPAVSAEQRHAAEHTFLELRHQGSLQLLRYLLENSHESYVLYEAGLSLRACVFREWTLMDPEQTSSICTYLVQYLVAKPDLQQFVVAELLRTTALVLKRGWAEGHRMSDTFFTLVSDLMNAPGDSMRVLAGKLILSVLNEFSAGPRCSDMGVTWEFHNHCKRDFERTGLKRCFELALQTLAPTAQSGVSSQGGREHRAVLVTFLAVAERALTWRFSPSHRHGGGHGAAAGKKYEVTGSFKDDTDTVLRPGEQWRDLFAPPHDVLELFFALHRALRHDEDLVSPCNQCIVQLATLDGDVFESTQVRASYYCKLTALLTEEAKRWANVTSEADSWFLATAVNHLVVGLTAFNSPDIYAMLGNTLPTLLGHMADGACACVSKSAEDAEGSWGADAFDQVVEAWVTLLSDPHFPAGLAVAHTQKMFDAFLQARLRGEATAVAEDADEEVFDEEDDEAVFDDQLVAMAVVGRNCPEHALATLTALLNSAVAQLQRSTTEQESYQCLGAIHWGLMLGGHVLADAGQGETPLVPHALLLLSCEKSNAHLPDPVVELTSAAFRVLECENEVIEKNMHHLLSPLTSRSLVSFLSRWAHTYLLMDPTDYSMCSKSLLQHYGKDSPDAERLVGVLANKAVINLVKWSAEIDLAQHTVDLLRTLSGMRTVRPVLCKVPAMAALLGFVDPHSPLSSLPGDLQGALACTTLSAMTADAASLQKWASGVLEPLGARFQRLVSASNLRDVMHTMGVKEELCVLLHTFIGVAQGTEESNVSLARGLMDHYSTVIVQLLRLYADYGEVVSLVLRLMVAYGDRVLPLLSDAEALRLFAVCADLMKAYSEHHLGKRKRADGVEEQAEELLLLLQLLTHLVSRDFLDFGDDGNFTYASVKDVDALERVMGGMVVGAEGTALGAEVRITHADASAQVADVVFYGLRMVAPLMSESMLQYPALCSQYFKLVSFLCEAYAARIAALDDIALLDAVCVSLSLGVRSFGPAIAKSALEGIASLAVHACECAGKGQQLSGALMHNMHALLRLVFETILLEDIDATLVDPAAEAFFPLICLSPEEYRTLVEQLLASQHDHPQHLQRLVDAFNRLMSANELATVMSNQNTARFKTNLREFLMNVRGFLSMR